MWILKLYCLVGIIFYFRSKSSTESALNGMACRKPDGKNARDGPPGWRCNLQPSSKMTVAYSSISTRSTESQWRPVWRIDHARCILQDVKSIAHNPNRTIYWRPFVKAWVLKCGTRLHGYFEITSSRKDIPTKELRIDKNWIPCSCTEWRYQPVVSDKTSSCK